MTTMIDLVNQDLAIEAAAKDAGICQMLDMCEWLEMETSVEFDWRKWVSSYEECPVDDHHLLTGNHKALFVQMINLCPDFDACVQAWKDYTSLASSNESSSYLYMAEVKIIAIEKYGNIRFSGKHKEFSITVSANATQNTEISNPDILTLIEDQTLNGLAVWVDGELDFMYGYPNLGPNGHMVAIETPAT